MAQLNQFALRRDLTGQIRMSWVTATARVVSGQAADCSVSLLDLSLPTSNLLQADFWCIRRLMWWLKKAANVTLGAQPEIVLISWKSFHMLKYETFMNASHHTGHVTASKHEYTRYEHTAVLHSAKWLHLDTVSPMQYALP